MAQSLPTGGTVVSGKVTIGSASPTSLTVNQSSSTAIVNWSSFSVGQGNQVQFNNGSGATLNRVTGNVPSSIDGLVSATGSVYLVNPAGVVVGPSGVVKTGGSFVASTLDVKDADFRSGRALTFSGNSNASVVNLGRIGASKGDVVLIARQVRNEGSLSARNGTAAMASGSEVVLSDGSLGNGKVLVRRPAQDGEVRNSGAIRAAEVELRANGGNVYALAGNTGGTITATGVANRGGRIFLTSEGGSVNVTQKVVARRVQSNAASDRRSYTGGDVVVSGDKVVVGGTIEAIGAGGAGGTVVVTGRDVTLTSAASIDASGTSGGTVLIGGDRAGGADAALKFLPQAIANAQNTTIDAGAAINANGTSGSGGNVVVWSDGTTSFGGAISATGLRGGFIETSGHVFNFAGGSVDAGRGGTWLLDPVDLTIDTTLAGTIATALNGGSNVTQQTTATGTGGSGDITVASGITWSTSATLTLSAYRNIAVSANITSSGGGGVVLRADNTGTGTGTVTFGGGQVSTAGTVSVYYNPTGSNSTVNATKYTAPTQADFAGNVIGGAKLDTYMLVNTVFDLQNMQNNVSGAYALGRDIDAGATASWNGGNGFDPIGTASSQFTGVLDGLNQSISNLVINRPNADYVGLFGVVGSGGAVRNIGLTGANVSGHDYTGGLIGYNNGGAIAQAYVSGSVTGNEEVGGLIGYSDGGSIIQAHSSGAVTSNSDPAISARGSSDVGGLIGYNRTGAISQSYSTATVSGTANNVGGLVGFNEGGFISRTYSTGAVNGIADVYNVGGLVGVNYGVVSQSYSTSPVNGGSNSDSIGGLVGYNGALISQSYATGAVNGTFNVGGLVGYNGPGATISQSYWDNYTTGQAAGVGSGPVPADLIAVTSDPSQSAAANYAFRKSAYANLDFTAGNSATGWFMVDGSTRPFGQWEYSTAITNTHQLQLIAMNLGASYKLASSIDFSSEVAVGGKYPGMWSSSGFAPIGSPSSEFAGSFDGNNLVISNLAIDLPSTNYVGLFGYASATATLSNVSLQAASVAGATAVGTLAGLSLGSVSNASASGVVTASVSSAGGLVGQSGGSITNSSAAVTVSSTAVSGSSMGGLVGWNNGGSIQDSYASGNVTAGNGAARAGGLVGTNNGAILRSYASGSASGGSQGVGGLVGYNGAATGTAPAGSILESYATGAVMATAFGGGLVGFGAVGSTVTSSHATGSVNVTGVSTSFAGGLIGSNSGTVIQSHATGAVALTTTDSPGAAGGLIGNNTGTAAVMRSYATGAVTSVTNAGASYAGGLIGRNLGAASITQAYATGTASATSVSGAATAGGLVGYQASTGAIDQTYATGSASATSASGTAAAGGLIGSITGKAATASYWDTDASGMMNAVGSGSSSGIVRLTTAQMQEPVNFASTYAGWDFATVWSAPSGGYYPQLYGVNYVLRVDPANASRVYGEANPAFTYSVYGLHGGDTAGIVAGVSVSTMATATSNVGTYAITSSGGSAISGSGQAYRIINAAGTLTVTPRAITVTADAQSRAYGDANPVLTYQVGGAGLVNGDTLSGALATSATTASNVGTYGITQGTLAASGNYAVNYVGNNLTVGQRALTVTADAKSRTYGDANPALTYQVDGAGLVNGDTLSGALATTATAASDVGVYGITQGTLAATSNYAFTFVGEKLTVTPVAATPTIRVPTAELGAYVQSRVASPAPQPPEPKREVASIDRAPAAIICKSRKCLELPHPHNRRIGERARFVDATASRDRLPAFAEN